MPKCDMRDFVRQYGGEKRGETFPSLFWDVGDLRSEVLVRLSGYLQELFEVPAEKITPEARLFEDLDLDSIDAVDLVVKLQEMTGRRATEEALQKVRTIGDIVKLVEDIGGS